MDQLTIATHDQKLQMWISRIRECKASGITVDEWCKQQGFSSKSYYYWMRKIKREAFEALPAERKAKPLAQPIGSGNTFAEIPVIPQRSYSDMACSIRFGNALLEVHNGADSTTIENILRAIRNLC